MSFFAICNEPYERNNITHPYITWDNGFNEEELNIISNLNEEDLNFGSLMGTEDEEKIKNIRISQVKFFKKTEETGWIFNRFNNIAAMINDQFYGFNLNGYDSFQYTVYKGEENGKYDWHMDTALGDNILNPKSQTRKLTLVMLLSNPEKDFTGGELEFNIGNEDYPMTANIFKGRIVAFPSFLIHRVKPVLTGIRKSIVIWIEGPKFV